MIAKSHTVECSLPVSWRFCSRCSCRACRRSSGRLRVLGMHRIASSRSAMILPTSDGALVASSRFAL
jgi:hypothetical protein